MEHIDEWEVEHDSGAMGFRLLRDGDGEILLDTRDQDDDGAWNEWEAEPIDGPGSDLLVRLPHLLKAERGEERAACAELVRTARCICGQFGEVWGEGAGEWDYTGREEADEFRPKLLRHHDFCPKALAERIEARGRG